MILIIIFLLWSFFPIAGVLGYLFGRYFPTYFRGFVFLLNCITAYEVKLNPDLHDHLYTLGLLIYSIFLLFGLTNKAKAESKQLSTYYHFDWICMLGLAALLLFL